MTFARTVSGDWIGTIGNVLVAVIVKTQYRYRVAKVIDGRPDMQHTKPFKNLDHAKNWCKKELGV